MGDEKYGDIVDDLTEEFNVNGSPKLNNTIRYLVDRMTDLDDREVNIKRKYGAIGDGTLRSISSVFPSATLAEVQALNAEATLSNSADWFAIQKAVINHTNLFLPQGDYITDLPIIFPDTPNDAAGKRPVTLRGHFRKTYIYNKGVDKNAFEVKGKLSLKNIHQEGLATTKSGILISGSWVDIADCEFNGNGRYGIEYDVTVHVVHSNVTNCTVYGNKLGGVYCVTNTTYQKTAIHFDKCYVVSNGSMVDGVAQTSGGHGFHMGACLGHNITNTVCEYNHGAGIYIANEGIYGVFGITVIGNYFEGNRLANILLNNADTSLAYKDIFIKGNYYSAYPAVGPTYYTNSRLNESIRVIVQNDNIVNLTNSMIEEKLYGFESNGVTTSTGGILTAPTRLKTLRIGNLYNDNEANIQFGAGAFVDRNIGDANPVLVARNNHGSFTGNLFEARNGVNAEFSIPGTGGFMNIRKSKTPASATATGTAGDICWDANYVYVCVATNTWKRTALATW